MYSETYLCLICCVITLLFIDGGIQSIELEMKRIRQLRIELDDAKKEALSFNLKVAIKTKF